jgi:WD40 repeat protein
VRGTKGVSAVIALVTTTLAAASAASATLTATRGSDRSPGNAKIVIARDDGSGRRVLANGEISSVSPDGSRVAVTNYDEVKHAFVNPRLVMFRTSGAGRTFTLHVDCPDVAWSPDSTKLACVTSGAPGRLVLIDAATGATSTLAKGNFDRPSFSPDSTRLAYVQHAGGPSFPVAGTLKIVDVATRSVTILRGAATRPVWGPKAIAFSTVVSRPRYAVLNVALIQPDGTGFRQITHIHARLVIFGVFPVAWSADGTRLLGGVVGQDAWTARESYAIDPVRGGFRLIAHRVMPSALSRDGHYVIGQTGDPECCGYKYSNIVRVPWAGGKKRVLVRHAMVASFSG